MADAGEHRSALDRLTGLVPVDAVLRNVDVQALIDRIDMNEVLDRIDMNAVVARMDLPAIVQRSVRSATSGTLDEVRAAGARLDHWITRQVDRLLRRSDGWRTAEPVTTVMSDAE